MGFGQEGVELSFKATKQDGFGARALLSSCGAAPVVEGLELRDGGVAMGFSPQCLSVDLNGDGEWDAHVWDMDGDGQPDTLDFDGDGTPDYQFPPPQVSSSASPPHDSARREGHEGTEGQRDVSGGGGGGSGLDGYFEAALALLREADLGAFGRGLGLASDHVNILGNNAVISDVLRIATGTKRQEWGASGGQTPQEGGDSASGDSRRRNTEKAQWAGPLLPDKIHSKVIQMSSKVPL
jgi:hypothetical protein